MEKKRLMHSFVCRLRNRRFGRLLKKLLWIAVIPLRRSPRETRRLLARRSVPGKRSSRLLPRSKTSKFTWFRKTLAFSSEMRLLAIVRLTSRGFWSNCSGRMSVSCETFEIKVLNDWSSVNDLPSCHWCWVASNSANDGRSLLGSCQTRCRVTEALSAVWGSVECSHSRSWTDYCWVEESQGKASAWMSSSSRFAASFLLIPSRAEMFEIKALVDWS